MPLGSLSGCGRPRVRCTARPHCSAPSIRSTFPPSEIYYLSTKVAVAHLSWIEINHLVRNSSRAKVKVRGKIRGDSCDLDRLVSRGEASDQWRETRGGLGGTFVHFFRGKYDLHDRLRTCNQRISSSCSQSGGLRRNAGERSSAAQSGGGSQPIWTAGKFVLPQDGGAAGGTCGDLGRAG